MKQNGKRILHTYLYDLFFKLFYKIIIFLEEIVEFVFINKKIYF
jgi:hypothetical protein